LEYFSDFHLYSQTKGPLRNNHEKGADQETFETRKTFSR